MKILKQLFTLAAIALLLTACNKNDEFAPETNSTFPADGIIRVATSVTNPQTRAGMTTAGLQGFQLRIINEDNPAYSFNAWMNKEEGEWKSYISFRDYTPLTLLWQNKKKPIKVLAVRIHTGWIENHGWDIYNIIDVPSSQDSENSMKNADILYMEEKEIDPSSDDLVNGKIPIVLNHRLSKLNLTIKMGTEFNKLDGGTTNNLISDMIVAGTSVSVNWNIVENTLLYYSDIYDITPWHNTAAYIVGEDDTTQAQAKYECILLPETVAAGFFKVSFTIGDRDFSWTSPTEVELAADTQYNLTLNVGKDVVTVGGFSATPWTEANEQNIGTE